ncbi:hypothetical protein PTTG_30265, partial [Puccinia triticina 1-1 BBBD Race 1]
MRSTFCLGQFIIPISSPTHLPGSTIPQVGFLQRGRRRVHVYQAPQKQIGDLSDTASKHLGPLIGPVSTCSTPVTDCEISPTDPDVIKIRAFVVTLPGAQLELRGCVFSCYKNVALVQSAFKAARVELTTIWNYNPSVFFEIPHYADNSAQDGGIAKEDWLAPAFRLCRTKLKPHQLTALRFLRENESSHQNPSLVWNHPSNAWLRSFTSRAGIETTAKLKVSRSRGSILADNMGLGKTLTTLAHILSTSDSAVQFHWADWIQRSAETLVICPLATLSNWEAKIRLHFEENAITYQVFHGASRKQCSRTDLQSALVVLTTYEMIAGSADGSQEDQLMVELLNLCWFRVVIDEAHLMKNPDANQTRNIQQLQSEFVLCLTGTPVQNRLKDLQSLITMLRIALWDEDLIWKRCLIPRMNLGAAEAIRSLTSLMQTVCLRRTKEVILNLPDKVEHAVIVRNSPQWEEVSRELHQTFVATFGRL